MCSALVHLPLGRRIPDRLHAVSCSLPTLRDVIGYEEKDPAVTTHLTSGYPRFVVHPLLREAAAALKRGRPDLASQELWLCAGPEVAAALRTHLDGLGEILPVNPWLAALAVPAPAHSELGRRARAYLQHTGGFGSSRAAEDWLVEIGARPARTPETPLPHPGDLSHVRSRVAAMLDPGLAADAVHLAPSGMAATYAAFQAVNDVQSRRGRTRWIQLGWLYLDTIAILQKFTARPDADYLAHGDVFDLDGLERLLDAHAGQVAGLFAEVPTNPLIQTPKLARVAHLCRSRGIALVVDPTIASPLNLDVLPHADIVVNSLTKYAASEGDVILGAAAVNPDSPLASELAPALARRATLAPVHPRDLARLSGQIDAATSLLAQINATTPRVAAYLASHPKIAEVHWSGHPRSSANYAALERSPGRAGSMITFTLRPGVGLAAVYDKLRFAKGPSFGLSTTLVCPFMYLAHYDLVTTPEGREKLRREGLDPELLRLSVGTEPAEDILAALAEALA